jgi:NAD(P)-dependent dehydrogenase (short-subunit alcohol dehydrogenase family)
MSSSEVGNLYDLRGQAALVTGAARGIGLGIAHALARAGSGVVIADLDLGKARESAEEIKRAGREAIALPVDVADANSVRGCVQAAIEHFSTVNILVNNAGIHCERLGELSNSEDFHRCFDVNLIGAWRMAQALVPHFKAHRTGNIVNIASINGRVAWADAPAYSSSKAAVINLTQSLAMSLGPYRINVNAVCPGGVITAMADLWTSDPQSFEEALISARVLKRPILVEDIAHAVVFFASPQARNITGQALNVDGGEVFS